MARTKYPTPLVARDMLIDICPRGADEWTGTRAQIESEGILQGLDKWPEGKADKQWEFGPFRYWLHTHRPPESEGRSTAANRLLVVASSAHRLRLRRFRDSREA